nr:FAD synthetase family protein [Bacteroidales bacterium]
MVVKTATAVFPSASAASEAASVLSESVDSPSETVLERSEGTVVATGFFDGVHLGHRHLIQSLVNEAHRRHARSLIVTFWPHPRNVLQDGARELRLLTSLQEKKNMLYALGVDQVKVLDFTREFSALTMREYVSQVLVGRFNAQCLVLGYDNRMGCDCRDG